MHYFTTENEITGFDGEPVSVATAHGFTDNGDGTYTHRIAKVFSRANGNDFSYVTTNTVYSETLTSAMESFYQGDGLKWSVT